jgi:hypothetical protein
MFDGRYPDATHRLRWQEERLQVPEAVSDATEQYRLDMDLTCPRFLYHSKLESPWVD